MNTNEYQKAASRTLISAPDFEITSDDWNVISTAFRLSIDFGKMIDAIKKMIFHQHGVDKQKLSRMIDDISSRTGALSEAIANHGFRISKVDVNLSGKDQMAIWTSFGLAGEIGEILEKVELLIIGKTGKAELTDELGDLQWYAAAICETTGIQLGDVLKENIEKLKARYPDGWDAERSKKQK